jgi:hypothetical protein
VADQPEGAGAVVPAPAQRRRSEGALDVALVGVDVRREQERELAHVAQLPGDERPADVGQPVAVGEHHRAVRAAEAAVHVAGVALARVELGHEGQGHALLGGDLLGAVLVDDVAVTGPARLVVEEGDLVLTQVALALGRLHHQPGAGHVVADPPQQRLDPRGAQHRVVDVVLVGRRQVAVAGVPGLLVGVPEDEELQLRADVGRHPGLGQAFGLPGEHLPRGRDHGAPVLPAQVGQDHRRAGVPRHRPQRREVRLHHEVAVAAGPGGHRVALDGVHVDVDRQQVVAALGGVLEDDVQEVLGVQALALQAALHVGERHQDGVHAAGLDVDAQLLDGEGGAAVLRQGSPGRAQPRPAPPGCPGPSGR